MGDSDLCSENGRKVRDLAKVLGCPWYYGPFGDWTSGLGHAVDNYPDLCHEMGHFLVASKSRNLKRHYGLGHPSAASPSGNGRVLGGLVTYDFAALEEQVASLCGCLILAHLGLRNDVSETLEDHDWLGRDCLKSPLLARIRKSDAMGILTETDFRVLEEVWAAAEARDVLRARDRA